MGERVGKELRTQSSIIASEAESPLANCCEGTEEEPTAKNLVITIHLKKMEPSGTNPNQLDPKDEVRIGCGISFKTVSLNCISFISVESQTERQQVWSSRAIQRFI